MRGGVDRSYASDVKEYIQSSETSDIVIGVESKPNNGDIEINFYFIPTLAIEELKQGSVSVNKIPQTKNNWEILLRCKEKNFVDEIFNFNKKAHLF